VELKNLTAVVIIIYSLVTLYLLALLQKLSKTKQGPSRSERVCADKILAGE
jgi:hypothetical protein